MLYREEILDHYRHPQNFGRLKQPTHRAEFKNASCGDQIEVGLLVKDSRVIDIRFDGRGCALSVATASLLTEAIKGLELAEVKHLALADVVKLIGEVNPGRHKCILMSLEAIKLALTNDPTTINRDR